MGKAMKKKVFYHIDEVCERLGLSLLDMTVLVSEGKIKLCTAVPGMLVEEGLYEPGPDGHEHWVLLDRSYVRGLVDLRPEDAWHVLRAGSRQISLFDAAEGRFQRIINHNGDDLSVEVTRADVGVRHEELRRYALLEDSLDEIVHQPKGSGRGSLPHYDWEAARLEACARIYFEGVPESYGALIRHVQAWFAKKGGKVPDESTMKRRLRDIWDRFGPEGAQKAA